ncbi:MAG: hypothetical protein DELT_02268 [Desulfovibrio sp.]
MVTIVHKLSNWLDTVCGVACVICLTIMVLLTGAQIVCRVAFTALDWSEELTRYLMVWATFLGASCVYKRMGHISVTVLHGIVPASIATVMQVASHLLCALFFVLAAVYGMEYMLMQSFQKSAALRIPMSWMYLAIPIGCSIMVLHVVDLLCRMVSCKCDGEETA